MLSPTQLEISPTHTIKEVHLSISLAGNASSIHFSWKNSFTFKPAESTHITHISRPWPSILHQISNLEITLQANNSNLTQIFQCLKSPNQMPRKQKFHTVQCTKSSLSPMTQQCTNQSHRRKVNARRNWNHFYFRTSLPFLTLSRHFYIEWCNYYYQPYRSYLRSYFIYKLIKRYRCN